MLRIKVEVRGGNIVDVQFPEECPTMEIDVVDHDNIAVGDFNPPANWGHINGKPNEFLSLALKMEPDENPDLSFLGEYTSKLEDGVIVRRFKRFWEDLTEEEKEKANHFDLLHTGFKPEAAGEALGTENYYKYGMQDYELAQKFANDELWMETVQVVARVKISQNEFSFPSPMLGGVECSQMDYVRKEVIPDMLDELRGVMKKIFICNMEKFEEEALKLTQPEEV